MSNDEIARLRQAFEQDGCLKSYIELGRQYLDHEIGVNPLDHLQFLVVMGDFLSDHGIDFRLISGALGTGKPAARKRLIEELSLQLIERIHYRQELQKQGHTQIESRNPELSDSL